MEQKNEIYRCSLCLCLVYPVRGAVRSFAEHKHEEDDWIPKWEYTNDTDYSWCFTEEDPVHPKNYKGPPFYAAIE